MVDLHLHLGSGSVRTLLLPTGGGEGEGGPVWQWMPTDEISDALGLVLPERSGWEPEVFAPSVAPILEGLAARAWQGRSV